MATPAVNSGGELTLRIPTVDLFAGCGGLSLGFETFSGNLDFETVLAIDNDQSVIRCFNDNHPVPSEAIPIGRLADLTWFAHPSEVLLYYVAHRAMRDPSSGLLQQLEAKPIRWSEYLRSLRSCDRAFASTLEGLAASAPYRSALQRMDGDVFTLAICKSFLGRLHLSSLQRGKLNTSSLPWFAEYSALPDDEIEAAGPGNSPETRVIREGAGKAWDAEVAKIRDAAEKRGRGQHSVVNSRLRALIEFLDSEQGSELRDHWVAWKSRRDSIRADRCLKSYPALKMLYTDDIRVRLILGGPPCKGFSRIGRAVLESLRDQGASAWTSQEFGDERNALMHKFVLFLEALRPDAFLFENVAHFASALRTPTGQLDAAQALKDAITDLSGQSVHYEVQSQIVKARDHAVPQDRERFIMVGFNVETTPAAVAANEFFNLEAYNFDVPLLLALQGLDRPGEFTFGQRGATAADPVRSYTLIDPTMPPAHVRYLEWIRQPDPQTGVPPTHSDAHVVRRGRPDDMALIRRLAPGQRWMDLKLRSSETLEDLRITLEKLESAVKKRPKDDLPDVEAVRALLGKVNDGLMLRLLLEDVSGELPDGEVHHLLNHGYLDKGTDSHGDWLERLSAYRPCKTVVAHIGKDTYGYIHPYEDRAISMREAARVQSFPDWYRFSTTGIVDGYAMIGNAVPPLLANSFARQMDVLHRELGLFSKDDDVMTQIELSGNAS